MEALSPAAVPIFSVRLADQFKNLIQRYTKLTMLHVLFKNSKDIYSIEDFNTSFEKKKIAF